MPKLSLASFRMFLTVILVGAGGATAILATHALSPSGSLSCASNATNITLTYNYANTTLGVYIIKKIPGAADTTLSSFPATSGSGHVDGGPVSSGVVYTYVMTLRGSGNEVTRTSCALTPSATMSCAAATTSSITVALSYKNASSLKPITFYRATTLLSTYSNGTKSLNYLDNGLAAGTSYGYQLKTGGTVLASATCSTVAAPAPPPPAPSNPTPTPATTPTPAPSPAPTRGPSPSPTPAPSPPDNSGSTSPTPASSLEVVYSDNSGSVAVEPTPTTALSDSTGNTGTDNSGSSNDTTTSAYSARTSPATVKGKARAPAKKTSTATVAAVLGLSALLILAIPGVFLLVRRRGSGSAASNPAANAPIYTVPTQVTALPLPLPPTPATNAVEQRINDAFYPTQAHRAPAPVVKSPDEPLDMFESARQHPETYGNTHIGQTIVTPLVQLEPVLTPTAELPVPHETPTPTTATNADDSTATMHIKH